MPASRPRMEPWPIALGAALCFMVGTGLGFYRLASANPDPLVVTDGHDAERSVPESLRAARAALALGWSIDLAASPRAGGADLEVRVRDAAGAPIELERVSVRRERPAEGGLDGFVALARGDETWAGAIELPRAGRWHLVVRAEAGGEAAERTFAWTAATP